MGPGQCDGCTLSSHGLDSVSVSSPVFLTLFFAGCGGSPFLHLSLHLSLSLSLSSQQFEFPSFPSDCVRVLVLSMSGLL